MKIKKIYIRGMHCVSCEKLLEDEFGSISGVKKVDIDRRKNEAEIFWEQVEPDFFEIKKIARKFGYDALEDKPKVSGNKGPWKTWVEAILILFILLALFRIFQSSFFWEKISPQYTNMSYGISFLVGLVASVSSCLAVVGAVVIGFSEKYKSEGKGFYVNSLRPNLFFHLGRLGAFFLLGGILGAIGGELKFSGSFVSFFSLAIAAVMTWLGLNILNIIPSISELGLKMPRKFTKKWKKLRESEHKLAPFVLGSLSFFLPCGFTQSMQVFALGSGSFWVGALSLFLFALGTLPVLLAVGTTFSWTKNLKLVVFQKVAGMLILLFAFFNFNSAWALRSAKIDVTPGSKSKQNLKKDPSADSKEQIVEMIVSSRGFEPKVLKIKKGIPVKWVINGDQVSGCTNRIIVPALNISQEIAEGNNEIRFMPDKSGDIPFSCWMGMVRGKFIVE